MLDLRCTGVAGALLFACVSACRSEPSAATPSSPAMPDPGVPPEASAQDKPEPKKPDEGTNVKGELVYVTQVKVPCAVLEGQTLVVTLAGNLPTPAWKLTGVEASVLESAPPRIMLTPRAQPPDPDSVSVQMLQPFERKVEVKDLKLGPYVVVARSREHGGRGINEHVEVLPKSVLVMARSQGGIAGIERSILVTTDKRARLISSRQTVPKEVLLDDAGYAAVQAAVQTLGDQGRTETASKGADLMSHQLAWVVAGKLATTSVDDGTIGEKERAVLAKLDELFTP